MNGVVTFFCDPSVDGSTVSVGIRCMGIEYCLEIYSRKPIHQDLLREHQKFDTNEEYSSYKRQIVADIEKCGGVFVEVGNGPNNAEFRIEVLRIDAKGADFEAHPGSDTIFFIKPGASVKDSKLSTEHLVLDLPHGSHIIVPVDKHAENRFRSFRKDYAAWFPRDFEAIMLESLRQPSLGLRINWIENKLKARRRPWMALAIGYICIVVSISFVFFIYHQINPNEAKIIVKEPPGDQAPNQTKHPSAPTTEPPPPPDVVKLMESALLQAKDLLKILDKAVVELEIKKLDVEAKVKEVKNEKRLLSNALNAKQVDKENAEIDAAKKAKALADLETQANDQNPNSRRKADQARKKMPSAITDDKAAKEKALESKRAFKEAKAADEEADHKLVRAEQELTKALANVETTTVKKTNAATAVDNIQKAIDAFEAAKKASDALK